jgi:hypothetical protein
VRRLVPLVAALLLSGCFTGARPSFGQGDPFAPGTPTGDKQAAPLLALLDSEPTGPLHAEYDVLTKYGNTTSTAAVTIDGSQRNVVIANVRYLVTGEGSFTCSADGTVPCVEGLDATRVSNVGVTPHFYASDIARRIRREEQAKIGPTTLTTRAIAGVNASCLGIPLGRGVSHYCVLPSGVVALLDVGDVRITLTAYTPTADPSAFQK